MGEIKVFYDISPVISEQSALFSCEVPFQRKVSFDFKKGDSFVLSSIETSVHVGAHADAPNHYDQAGPSIETRSLEYYLGPVQVIEVKLPHGRRITEQDIAEKKIEAKRVLFKTRSFPNPNQWNSDFNSLSASLIDELASKSVVLVGIDTPSIDLSSDDKLEAHRAVFKNDMAILEGIVLDNVPEGKYMLSALPLKIKGADASPVRAVLWKI